MPIRIHTHNGACHADEIVAIAILLMIYPDAVITRSRNPKDWEAADLVIDVGELLDYVKFFDHHQKEGKPEPRPNGVPYASAGLVLKTFGLKWVSSLAAQHGLDPQSVVDCIDALFIQPIDAKDVGQIDLSARLKDKDGRIVQHEGRDVTLATNDFNSLMRLFAPVDFLGEVDEDALFMEAVAVTRIILGRVLMAAIGQLKAPKIVRDADTGAALLVLEIGCPWHPEVVHNLPHVKLVVLPDGKGGWMVAPVPLRVGAQEYRLAIPAEWKGKKGAELCQLAGIEGLKLCTESGHVLFTLTRVAAEDAAKKILG